MNFNGKKNPFTLDNSAKRCETNRKWDLFARDPFKVQSYNFRYADPPGFPLKSPYNTCPKTDIPKCNFYESRRRKFVQSNNNTASNMSSNQGKKIIPQQQPKVYADYGRPYYRPPPPDDFPLLSADMRSYGTNPEIRTSRTNLNERKSFHCGGLSGGVSSNTRFEPSKRSSTIGVQHLSRTNTMSTFNTLKPKTSTSSLCQINIKIQRSEDNLLQERLVINIATNDNNALCTGTSPYNSDCLAFKGETSSNSLAALGYSPSHQALQAQKFDQGLTDTSFSSDSSTASDYGSQPNREMERLPQWISVMNSSDKSNTLRDTQSRPKLISPYLGIQKNEVFKRVERKNSVLIEKRSTQTLVNNLNTDDMTKSKTISTRNASKSVMSITDRKPGQFTSQLPQARSELKRSTTDITRRDFSIIKKPGPGNNVSSRGSALNLRRTASTVTRSGIAENSPLRVNINLYSQQRSF